MAALLLLPLVALPPVTVAAAVVPPCFNTFGTGGSDTAAISTGVLFAWGNNSDGQLGQGVFGGPGRPLPQPVVTTSGLTAPSAVWSSGTSTFAVDVNGQLWGWGDNFHGELAQPTTTPIFTIPTQIAGVSHAVSVSSAGFDTVALTSDGAVWGWGMSPDGELGFVKSTQQVTPVQLPGLSKDIVEVSDGAFSTVVLDGNGNVFGTGQNIGGQMGLGSGVPQLNAFQQLPGLSNITQVATNDSGFFSAFVVAVDQFGNVWTAGNNGDGEMGQGSPSFTGQFVFLPVPNFGSVKAVAAGSRHVLALKQDGTVWAWGSNSQGQLGNGTLDDSATPVQVQFPAGTQLMAIAAGDLHSVALDSTGALWAWGSNTLGQLGTGTAGGFKTVPVKVSLGSVDSPTLCGTQPKAYLPSVNGYRFGNPGGAQVTVPDYDRMVSFYPDSRFEIEYPVFNTPTNVARWFHKNLWVGTYQAGLCYGMVTSSQFLFSHFPDQSAVALYSNFPSDPFPGALGGSPSPADTTIEQFIDRYHSRQLAAAGALSSIGSWKDTQVRGNTATFAQIEADVASGKTEWVGLGPSEAVLTEGPDKRANAIRWWSLYNASHAVLAYRADKPAGRIFVYDPNSPLDDQAFIELKDSPINPGGGILVVHNGVDTIQANLSYGGGGDLGLPGEWSLMPLPEASFTEQGSVPLETNRKWVLDAAGPIAVITGGTIPTFLGVPIFLISGSANAPSESEFLPAGSGLNEVITAARPGASTSQQSGSHVVDVIQNDAAAAGTTHQVSISQDASLVDLSSASSVQQYTVALAADFLPSYGRSFTVTGANLVPGATLELSADQAYSSLSLSASSMPTQQASLLLEQAGQGTGSANVTVTVPGGGGRGVVFVSDWTGLGQSLIFESIRQSDGTIVGLLLQDNTAQRQQLIAGLLESVQADVSQVSGAGTQNSLQAKLNNAGKQVAAGDPRTAANILVALDSEVTEQTGVTVPADLAATFHGSLQELIGLLRASPTA